MRISDWSSYVCSSDLVYAQQIDGEDHRENDDSDPCQLLHQHALERIERGSALDRAVHQLDGKPDKSKKRGCDKGGGDYVERRDTVPPDGEACLIERSGQWRQAAERSEERRVGKGCVITCRFRGAAT